MIAKVQVPHVYGIAKIGLRPVGDSLPLRTWRGHPMTKPHRYPTEGCHGAPLDAECRACKGHTIPDPYCEHYCQTCNGTGRVPLDHPNRTDTP